MKSRLVLAAAIALYGWASVWEGGTAPAMAAEVSSSEVKTITLFENTTLQDETGKVIGIIAPQRVAILGTSLHELEASDEKNQVEVDFSYRYFDPTSRKTTIDVITQLGPSWSEHKESVPVEFSVWFYNEQGQRIGISDWTTSSLVYGESQNIRLSVDNDITKYAYATVHIGKLSGHLQTEINTSDSMEIVDPSQPALRLGAIRVRQDGEYSIIHGQFQLDMKGQNRVKGILSFLDSNGKVIGKAPLDLAAASSFPGKGTVRAFETILSGDVTGYTYISLEVTSFPESMFDITG